MLNLMAEDHERLWSSLSSLEKKLDQVMSSVTDMIRTEEKVKAHSDVLARFGRTLDEHRTQIHNLELWKEKNSVERLEKQMEEFERDMKDIKNTLQRMDSREQVTNSWAGFGKGLLKWASGIVAAIVTAYIGFRIGKGE